MSYSKIPPARFNSDGDYRLHTTRDQYAAMVQVLRIITMIPQAYYGRGPAFCRDEQTRVAREMLSKIESIYRGDKAVA